LPCPLLQFLRTHLCYTVHSTQYTVHSTQAISSILFLRKCFYYVFVLFKVDYSLALANRSACLYKLGYLEKSLEDTLLAERMGYPQEKMYKLMVGAHVSELIFFCIIQKFYDILTSLLLY